MMNVRKPERHSKFHLLSIIHPIIQGGAPSGYGGFLFPKMGGPPNHPSRDGIFHEINHL